MMFGRNNKSRQPIGSSKTGYSSSCLQKGAQRCGVIKEDQRTVSAGGKIRRIGLTLFCLVSITVLFQYGQSLVSRLNQPIRLVQIEGSLKQLSEKNIRAILSNYTHQGFLQIELHKVKQDLEKIPWVESVIMRRQWPDVLSVVIKEKVAIARWRNNHLLSQEGSAFSPGNIDTHKMLPLLVGPENSQQAIMRQFQKLNQLLKPLGIKVSSLYLSERSAWSMELDNGLNLVVGRDLIMEKLRRFVDLYKTHLKNQINDIQTVDLRYVNGLAISKIKISASLSLNSFQPLDPLRLGMAKNDNELDQKIKHTVSI